jgi:WD40 repeat protein
MSRISSVLFLLLASFVSAALVTSSLDAVAQDKKKDDKKDVKDDKKDPKKEEKKEEKKEPFKPDPAQQELKPDEKEKSVWVYDVAFGADGKSVAAAYRNHSVKIWDLAKKNALILKGPEQRGLGDFKSILYANNHVFVGTGKLTKDYENLKKKDKKKESVKEKESVKQKEIVKDKEKIKEKEKEVPIREGEIKVWDAKTGKPGKSLLGHLDDIESLAISKDGKFIASASRDNTVKIWDAGSGKDIQTLKGHNDAVTSVSFSPDGKQVVTTSLDKTVRVWDIAGAKEVANFKVERMVEVKDPKGKISQVKEIGREFTHALFSNDGKKVFAGNLEGVVKIYDVEDKKEMKELKGHDGILAFALSPDGSKLATGGWDQTIKIWNTADGKELRTIKAHLGSVTSLSFSPDGQWLASGSTDGMVKIWSVK